MGIADLLSEVQGAGSPAHRRLAVVVHHGQKRERAICAREIAAGLALLQQRDRLADRRLGLAPAAEEPQRPQ